MRTLKVIIETENPNDYQKLIGSSDCVMMVVSRHFCETANLSNIKEMNRPALYLLVDEETKAYIGQTRSFNSRVKDHLREKKWWTRAYVFVSDAGRYNTASVEYLEYLAIQEGLAVGIYDLSDNWQIPTEPTLQKWDRNEYDEIFEGIKFFLSYERCSVFIKTGVTASDSLQEKVLLPDEVMQQEGSYAVDDSSVEEESNNVIEQSQNDQSYPIFLLRHPNNNNNVARGYLLNEKTKTFVMLKGSEIAFEEKNIGGGGVRKPLLKKCVLREDEVYELKEDFTFKSPSAAARACVGGSCNGPSMWVTEEGVTLKSYMDNLEGVHS